MKRRTPRRHLGRVLGRVGATLLGVFGGYLLVCCLLLVIYRWVDPPLTSVQVQQRIAASIDGSAERLRYHPVDLENIDEDLILAVVVAEDSYFLEHRGIDWKAVLDAVDEGGRRGGSTITQQLVKNLFLTTRRSYLRKLFEVPLAYAAEFILGKRRILELYLNVIEWGPGVYGAHAAAAHHYGRSPGQLTAAQAAGLAACIPAPKSRTPNNTHRYQGTILARMGIARHRLPALRSE